jgi:hypothetical protein
MARRSCADLLLSGTLRLLIVAYSLRLLVAARPWPRAAVSRLAKRPASAGLPTCTVGAVK